MARFVVGMNQSLDGYVDHTAFAPGPDLFRHFVEEAQGQVGAVYGRRMYEVLRGIKDDHEGEIEVAGPQLAQAVGDLGLIDEYRIYLHPVVVGHGKRFFAGPRSRLRLVAHDQISEDVVRLTYLPA